MSRLPPSVADIRKPDVHPGAPPAETLAAGPGSLRTEALSILTAAVVGALCVYAMRKVDPDLYGYLAYGRLFVEQGRIAVEDPFAYTSTGSTWVAFEWLAQLTLWIAYDTAGPLGLIGLKCLLGGIAVYFVYDAVRFVSGRDFHWLPVFCFVTANFSRYFVFRPQLFTFAFFALFVAVLLRHLMRRRTPLWVLPIVMLVWANSHGGFLAGLGAIGLFVALRIGENVSGGARGLTLLQGTRALWLALGACTAVTLLNPRGVDLWRYVLTELTHSTNRQYIGEWGPAHSSGDMWSFAASIVTCLCLALGGWISQWRRPPSPGPVPGHFVLSAVPLAVMAFLSVRHTPILAIWSAPVLALTAAQVRGSRSGASRVLSMGLLCAALTSVLITMIFVAQNPRPAIAASGNVLGPLHPCQAVGFMREQRLAGNVYVPLPWGSYVTWHLYPAVRVSMDGRNISLFPRDMVRESLEYYTSSHPDLETPLRYDTDFLLVRSNFSRLDALEADTRWTAIHRDSDAVLFKRVDGRDRLPAASSDRQPQRARRARRVPHSCNSCWLSG